LVAAHDEGPRLALGAGDLGVDEHVLDLLAAPGESVARPPASYLKACELGLDPPVPPANRALERDRATLEPGAVVRTDELNAVAVCALRLGPGGATARDEPVEDRLDLIGGCVAGGAEPVGREAVANLAQLVLGPTSAAVDDLGAHQLATEARVCLGLFPAQAVVDVERRDAIAELAQEVPRAGRIGA